MGTEFLFSRLRDSSQYWLAADRSTTSVVQKIAIDCRFNLLAVCARDSHKTSRFQMLASHTLPDGSPAPPRSDEPSWRGWPPRLLRPTMLRWLIWLHRRKN